MCYLQMYSTGGHAGEQDTPTFFTSSTHNNFKRPKIVYAAVSEGAKSDGDSGFRKGTFFGDRYTRIPRSA